MPLTKLIADALGVVTIALVAISSIIASICVFYAFYFRSHIRTQQPSNRLNYFSGPWATRILLSLFTLSWGLPELLRLHLLLQSLPATWQNILCKSYLVSNLGFSEPCLFLTLLFLLRASLQKTEFGPLSANFNRKTAFLIFLYSSPILTLQILTIILSPRYENGPKSYFFKITYLPLDDNVSRCRYPLASTTLLGLFAMFTILYMFYLGRKILKSVISKSLKKRVFVLITAVCVLFPLRVLLIGLSVLTNPGEIIFEVFAFISFLSILICANVAVCVLVYYPIADSLELKNMQDVEDRRRIVEEYNDTLLLIANSSSDSGKRESISFRRDESPGAFVELSLFSPSQRTSPVGSPWPMGSG